MNTGTHLQNHLKNFNILLLYRFPRSDATFSTSLISIPSSSLSSCFSCSCVIISEILVSDCKGTDFLAIILAKFDFFL